MIGKETFSMMQEGNPDDFDARQHYSEEELRVIEESRTEVVSANPASFAEVRAAAEGLLRALGVSAEIPTPSFDAANPEGMFHYSERMDPERIMGAMKDLVGRFAAFGSGSIQAYRDMERYGRQLLEYSVELEEAWKASHIRAARRDIVSRVPGLLREADAMEKSAKETVRSLGMEPASEHWELVRQYYFEIPDMLRDLDAREEEMGTETGWAEGDGTLAAEAVGMRRKNAEGKPESFPSLRKRYEDLRSAIEADLRDRGVRTDLSREDTDRFRQAVDAISYTAPARRAVARGMGREAVDFLKRSGAEVPGNAGDVVGTDD